MWRYDQGRYLVASTGAARARHQQVTAAMRPTSPSMYSRSVTTKDFSNLTVHRQCDAAFLRGALGHHADTLGCAEVRCRV
jgi:hypothetical protein